VEQLPLTASHPPLGCHAFIACTNLRYLLCILGDNALIMRAMDVG